MQYITTTNLRTKSSKLVEALKRGSSVNLIHRSRVIGEIKPKHEPRALTEKDIQDLEKLAEQLNLPKLSYKERERRYRKYLMEKYGKGLSRY